MNGPTSGPAGSTSNLTGSAGPTQTSANTAGSTSPANNVPCYCSGTRIRTDRGEVAVEDLRVGNFVVTATQQHRAIRWIGTRRYPGFTAPQADRPVRIRAGALSDGVPTRDLLISPDHGLYLDGLLVAAGHLVNGASITRGEAVRDLTYWHIELDSHDILLAEGALAESFLPAPGVRVGFDGVQALDAGAAPVPYAPRAEISPELATLRGRLARRTISAGEAADFGSVRAWLDRCVVRADGTLRVAGWAQSVTHLDIPVCLDIVVDGAIVAMAVAAEYRADLAAAGLGSGHHGFDLGLTTPLVPRVPHTVEVRCSAGQRVICAMALDAEGKWTPLLAA